MTSVEEVIDRLVRDVPDFPQAGVVFKDIAPLLADGDAFHAAVSALVDAVEEMAGGQPVDKVVGIEARGFILAAPVALALGAGFVPVRKEGKLPRGTHAVSFELEYGSATIEVQQDAFDPGDRVAIVDDVLATGGTAVATRDLVRTAGADVVGVAVLIHLSFLHGSDRFEGLPLRAGRTF